MHPSDLFLALSDDFPSLSDSATFRSFDSSTLFPLFPPFSSMLPIVANYFAHWLRWTISYIGSTPRFFRLFHSFIFRLLSIYTFNLVAIKKERRYPHSLDFRLRYTALYFDLWHTATYCDAPTRHATAPTMLRYYHAIVPTAFPTLRYCFLLCFWLPYTVLSFPTTFLTSYLRVFIRYIGLHSGPYPHIPTHIPIIILIYIFYSCIATSPWSWVTLHSHHFSSLHTSERCRTYQRSPKCRKQKAYSELSA